MQSAAQLVEKLKRNPVFKFLSSIRLAIPLMLFLAVIVAVGTIYESRYNTQIAQIIVYKSYWFLALLILFWINIFCATVSRIPFKKHHTGFVITHIGLLTLLYGSALTFIYGIDGQLRIIEGQSNNTVSLQNLVLKVADRDTGEISTHNIQRYLEEKSKFSDSLNEFMSKAGIHIDKFLPFVAIEPKYIPSQNAAAGDAVEFKLVSPFFNVTQSVHTKQQPELSMGPAKIRIVSDSNKKTLTKTSEKLKQHHLNSTALLKVYDLVSGKLLASVSVAEMRQHKIKVNAVDLEFIKTYEGAVVSNKKLIDNQQKGYNPAIEFHIIKNNQPVREIIFEKYPEFNLNQGKSIGLRFQYTSGSSIENTEVSAEDSVEQNNSITDRMQNTIEFHMLDGQHDAVRVELYKDNKSVASKILRTNEGFTTPWMGIQITPTKIVRNAELTYDVKSTPLTTKIQNPPSAIQIRNTRANVSDPVWLVEGDVHALHSDQSQIDVYYGVETLRLPFSIHVDKFSKVDYPGTSMPMSFESRVRINESGDPIDIKMNEPLKYAGFTFYQASYEMEPGQPVATILSVNKDPGRLLKYIGAIILCLGIVIFTVMRSRLYRNFNQGKAKS